MTPKQVLELAKDYFSDKAQIVEQYCYPTDDAITVRFKIITEHHEYHIVATNEDPEYTYLGCVANCREPQPGETWLRGNDLSDGILSRNTWMAIVNDIEQYESY